MRQMGEGAFAGAEAVAGVGLGGAVIAHVVRGKVALQHAEIGDSAILFCADGKVGEPVIAAFVGTVGNLPVPQASVAGDADRAGADAA